MANTRHPLILAALVSGAMVLPALAGDAGKPIRVADLEPGGSTLDVAYTISFWGIPFGHTNFNSKFRNDTYNTVSHFETSGVVSMFWQATIDANSNGQYAPHAFIPDVYNSYYHRGDSNKERVKVSFGAASPSVLADPPYDTTSYPVTQEQKKEALDPVSAVAYVLTAAKVNSANPCGTIAPVFDGRRRYNIQFTYVKDEPVKLQSGLFTGKAHLCQLHYNQIAGFKPKILKEGKAFPPIFGWFADVPSPNSPNGHLLIALKVWASTGWGTVTADLSEIKVNGGAGLPKG